MKALSAAKPGEFYTIKWIFGLPEVMRIMEYYKIRQGSEIQIVKSGKDVTIIRTDDRKIAMGAEAAQGIKV